HIDQHPTHPRSGTGRPSGGELRALHAYGRVLPSPCSRHRSAQRTERCAELGREQLRLLPRSEVAALVDLVEVDDVRVARLDPASRTPPDLAREGREGERDRWRRQGLLAG